MADPGTVLASPGVALKRLGKWLMLLGVLTPPMVEMYARTLPPGAMRGALWITGDALRLLFFGGLAAFAVGFVRDRRKS